MPGLGNIASLVGLCRMEFQRLLAPDLCGMVVAAHLRPGIGWTRSHLGWVQTRSIVAACPSVYRHFQGLQSLDCPERISPHFVLRPAALSSRPFPPFVIHGPERQKGLEDRPSRPTTARHGKWERTTDAPRPAVACQSCRSFVGRSEVCTCLPTCLPTYLPTYIRIGRPTSSHEEACTQVVLSGVCWWYL